MMITIITLLMIEEFPYMMNTKRRTHLSDLLTST